MPRAYKEKGAYESHNEEKGSTKNKNEGKGAYKDQNEGNRTSKVFIDPQKIIKVPRAYESLNSGLVTGNGSLF